MRKWHSFIVLTLANFIMLQTALADIVLDGHSLTPKMIAQVADGEKISISSSATKTVQQSHNVLIEAAQSGQKIYGLTVGVGLNKDQQMVDVHGKLSSEVIEASKKFNIGLLHAHSGSVGEALTEREARAAMVVRLNQMLVGGAGVQPSIIDAYVNFLNKKITPVIPGNSSIGEGDITVLSHIGLAMIGEGEVIFKGKKIPANQALKESNTPAIVPYAKDALSILSSNAYSASIAALAINDMQHLLQTSKVTYAISLEALNGNVLPFMKNTLALRPYPEVQAVGKELRVILEGSSLWNKDENRPLQDPLSFRSGVYILGELQRSYDEAYRLLFIQLNSSDDNPGVAINVSAPSSRDQEAYGYVSGKGVKGAVLPNANFEPLPWVLAFEQLSISLAHHSLASAQQVVKLNMPEITGLSRFLGTENTVHSFGAMEKPVMSLAMQNKALAMPVSMDYLPVAGNIEDIATNAPEVARRLQKQIDNSYSILGILLVHDIQAIDLRKQKNNCFKLSKQTDVLYQKLRNQIVFMEVDRPMYIDFAKAEQIIKE